MKNEQKKFFVSTPIYYPNDNLHIGHAYSTSLADIINRYKKSLGYQTFFLTGSDEHGEKIYQKAKSENVDIVTFLDKKIENFKILWKNLGIDYDQFIRTTDSKHILFVQTFFKNLQEKNLIYKDKYHGLYCVNDETFFTKNQIIKEGICPICGSSLKLVDEESYFLKISQYQSWIKNALEHENFLIPHARANELLNNFIPNLQDLSVTRTSFDWGVKVIDDDKHIVYVWLDALLNYISAFTYQLKKGWNISAVWNKDSDTEILQIIGKEITRFHAIYWPIILKIEDYKLPTVLSHGWIIDQDSRKMSKSLGNTVDPNTLIKRYGRDAIRFYFFFNISLGEDGKFSEQLLKNTINGILVNKFSNLINRSISILFQQYDGILPKQIKFEAFELQIEKELNNLKEQFIIKMNAYDFDQAAKIAILYIEKLNIYIEKVKPWKYNKNDLELAEIINFLFTKIWNSTILLSSVLIDTTEKILVMYNEKNINFEQWNKTFSNKKINRIDFLFKRLT